MFCQGIAGKVSRHIASDVPRIEGGLLKVDWSNPRIIRMSNGGSARIRDIYSEVALERLTRMLNEGVLFEVNYHANRPIREVLWPRICGTRPPETRTCPGCDH